jgi:tetratricopeptide (TPR) repeat protein
LHIRVCVKIDQKNAAAYNRLGILYAKQKEYKDAIDCFEIASSIEPTASSLHNLGLIYYETENYVKAATAFEQALKFEEDLAARHIAYAKVQEKLGNNKLMIEELKRAVDLEPNQESYMLLVKGYESLGMHADAEQAHQNLEKLIIPSGKNKKRVSRPKRVVI